MYKNDGVFKGESLSPVDGKIGSGGPWPMQLQKFHFELHVTCRNLNNGSDSETNNLQSVELIEEAKLQFSLQVLTSMT
jgi:hypothetical protein